MSEPVSRPNGHPSGAAGHEGMDRRSFLRTSAVLASGMAALAASLGQRLRPGR